MIICGCSLPTCGYLILDEDVFKLFQYQLPELYKKPDEDVLIHQNSGGFHLQRTVPLFVSIKSVLVHET